MMILEEEIKPRLKKIWLKTPAWIKQIVLVGAVLVIMVQTMLTVYSAIHSTWIAAYDERWYQLAGPHMNERNKQLSALQSEIQYIKSDVAETKTDVREMRVFLMGPKK